MRSESSRQRSFDPELDDEFRKLASEPKPASSLGTHVLNFATGAAVFAMVTALAYHLVQVRSVFYPYGGGELRWVLTCFIAAVVLIDRVRAYYGDAAAATPYQIGLGIAVGLFILRFTPASGGVAPVSPSWGFVLSFGATGAVWWLADRLARASMVDAANADAASAGIYERLNERRRQETSKIDGTGETPVPRARRAAGKSKRFKHPGLAVACFTGVGCVLFALTEPVVSRAGSDLREASFRYLVAFVGCGMFLLATTTLVSVRTYVHKKGIEVFPGAVPIWLVSAGVVVLAILALARILPAPSPGGVPQMIAAMARRGTPRQGSGFRAPVPGTTRPKPGERGARARPEAEVAHTMDTGGADRPRKAGDSSKPSDKGESRQGQQARKDRQGQGNGKAGGGSRLGSLGRSMAEAMGFGDDGKGGGGKGKGGSSKGAGGAKGGKPGSGKQTRGVAAPSGSGAGSLDKVVKFLAVIIVIALIVFMLIRLASAIRKHHRTIRERLKRMLDALRDMFKRKARAPGEAAGAEGRRYARLSSFANPFDAEGNLREVSAEEAARLSYQAILAFTRELGIPRREDETPLEYARRMSKALPQIRMQVQTATLMFTRVEYACKSLQADDIARMRSLWGFLERQKRTAVPV